MAPVLRATQRRPALSGTRGYGASSMLTSSSRGSRVIRLLLVFAFLALMAYFLVSQFQDVFQRYQAATFQLRQPVDFVLPPAITREKPKTAFQLAEEEGAREARQMEEEEAEEEEEEEVSPPDGEDDGSEDDVDDEEELEPNAEAEQDGEQQEQEEPPVSAGDDPDEEAIVHDAEGSAEQAKLEEEEGHSVQDPNAHDVQVEDGGEDEEEEEDEDEEEQQQENRQGPKPLPRYTLEALQARGLGHLLYAYRVVAPHVAVRTQPSPIGALAQSAGPKAVMGLMKDGLDHGDIVVGYKLSKQYGLWLKLAPHTWAPVLKKEVVDGKFHALMKQIRKITLPGNLRKYWRMRAVDCATRFLPSQRHALESCEERNALRKAVLVFMRKNKLMNEESDPELH